MSWLPSFKVGLWNAWILMFVIILHPLIMIVVDKVVGTGNIFKKMGDVPRGRHEAINNAISMIILCLLIMYSIFLPLKINTIWFYGGIIIWISGFVIFLTAIVNVATTPIGQVFQKGMYRFSRHPMYLSASAFLIGVCIASVSWVFLLLTVVYMVLQVSQVDAEEKACLKTYGDKYMKYMNSTPRWLGIPK